MKKASYFQIKSKIYHYYLAAVVLLVTAIMTAACIDEVIGVNKAANLPLSKMIYQSDAATVHRSDNTKERYDIPVNMEIARVSKYLFYQKPEKHRGQAFYLEVTDTDDNKFIMCAAYDNEVEKAIEIKETLAQNENNEDFFIHAVGTTDALTSSVLKSIKESSNSSLSLEEL